MIALWVLLVSTLMPVALAWSQPQRSPRPGAPPEVQEQARARPGEVSTCHLHARTERRELRDSCPNHRGRPMTITKVQCKTVQGSLVFHPKLTGGDPQSILAEPLTCSTTAAVGVLNGQPRLQSFAKQSAQCVGACSVDFLIVSVDGAEEAIFTIVGEYQ